MSERKPLTPTARSRARYQRAALRLPVVPLDDELARIWRAHQQRTGETWAAFARRTLRGLQA